MNCPLRWISCYTDGELVLANHHTTYGQQVKHEGNAINWCPGCFATQ